MKKLHILLLFLIFFNIKNLCQYKKISYFLEDPALSSRFLGNSIGDIIFQKGNIWISSTKGISKSSNNGNYWYNFYNIPEFVKPNISSFDIQGDTIWASLIYTTENSVAGSTQTGGGFTFSSDGGKSWKHTDQVKDNKDDSIFYYGKNKIIALPVVVDQQNVTWGISIAKNAIWINSWSSCLRKSTDFGKTFSRVYLPPDRLNSISPEDSFSDSLNPLINRNHLGFSVLAVDTNEIWAGTAGGVNKSTDGGKSWKKFTHKNQDSSILGNWIYKIRQQKFNSTNRIWVTNWKADDPDEDFGVSYTENRGKSWKNLLKGKKINNIAFKDSIVYLASNNGIIRTADNGKSFLIFDNIYDPISRYKIMDLSIYSIEPVNDTIWIGTGDGLVYTIDSEKEKFGTNWKIFRAYQSTKSKNSYVYPNPFAPDEEITRIHYSMPKSSSKVTIEIFDFGMNLIRRLVSNVFRSGNLEQEEIWDGKDEKMNRVVNGTYFYKIKMDDDFSWGKIIVLQ
jgi:hypothetical protein